MKSTALKLSVLEKVGYSLGDLAANLIFQTLMTFLSYFYTDVYKIPAATASVIIFVGGFFGAFFNIIMGAIADRTSTRWGIINLVIYVEQRRIILMLFPNQRRNSKFNI
jgi:Na+/melibiose symporter-like transporter